MTAIIQNLAPQPVAQNGSGQQASSQKSASDSAGSQPFKDVYSQTANGNGGNKQQASDDAVQQDDDAGQSANAGSSADDTTKTGYKSSAKDVADIVAKFAMNGSEAGATKAAMLKAGSDKAGDGKAGDDKAAAEAVAKAIDGKSASDEKIALLAKAAKSGSKATDATNTVPVVQPDSAEENDGASAALKLLGANMPKKQSKTAGEDTDVKASDGKKTAKDDTKEKDAVDDPSIEGLAALNGAIAQVGTGGSSQDDNAKGKEQEQASLNGKSSAVDEALDAGDDDAKSTKKAKVDTVNVLEARRFLGSETDTLSHNTKSVLANITGDKDWSSALKAASSAHTRSEAPAIAAPMNTLKIQMNPQDLGSVTATLRLKGDELTVHLSVETGEAFKQLSLDKDSLVKSLKSQGYSVDQVTIQLTVPTADKAVAQTSSGQQSGGQMQDGSAGQFAQQGRGQDGNRRPQDSNFGNWQNDDKIIGTEPSIVGADGARAGQVYL